ncbi:MAG: hypothetical protein E6G40_08340 [Actinobacteria bacterium]|nr:MAG: hypothetical protein E6G40_08340 [Actinomycetota bacterium]
MLSPYVPRLLVDWLRTYPDRAWRQVEGTLAFVDISGFTKMTERLARKGKVGAEEMNDLLNACFTELLRVAYADGAGLVKWGGDAVLLLFQGENHAARACRAAHGMRRSLRGIGRLPSSAGFVTLRMSVGIHSGRFDVFLAGDLHRELILAGPAASHTVAMESTAEAGQILVSEATARQLHPRFVGLPKGEGFLLKGAPNVPAQEAEPPPDVSGLDLTRCLPVGIRDHLLSGSGEPEHRHVSVAFIEFRGADDCLREKGPDALADALDRCIKDVQEACARHGVTFFETDIGKDGGKIMLVAGAPSSSGNDEAGMLNAVRRIMDRSTALPLRIGVNCGRVFAGDFGPSFRRTYSVKGDAVNLAARVMGKAEPGQILVTEAVLARSSIRFHVQTLEPFSVKGKTRPVHAYALGAAAGRKAIETWDLPLVGREAELATLRQALESATRRRGRVVELVGEPGIGKSRLVNELLAGSLDMTVIVARCEMYEASTPYFPLRTVLWEVLGIRDDRDRAMAATRFRDRIEANAPHLLPWLPLLGIPSGIEVPMTPEVEQLGDEFRRARLIDVSSEFLAWVLPTTTVLVFDDVHWMDEGSAELLRRLTEDVADRPWLILVTRREQEEGFHLPGGAGTTLRLEALRAADAADLVQAATEQLPMPQHEMVTLAKRSGGNPLFLRELVSAARSAGSVAALPDTVEGLMTSQIDRLHPADRTLLRTASVLGTSFSPAFPPSRSWPGSAVGNSWGRTSRGCFGSATSSSATRRTRGSPSAGGESSTAESPNGSNGPAAASSPNFSHCISSTPSSTRKPGDTRALLGSGPRQSTRSQTRETCTGERWKPRDIFRPCPRSNWRLPTRLWGTSGTGWACTRRRPGPTGTPVDSLPGTRWPRPRSSSRSPGSASDLANTGRRWRGSPGATASWATWKDRKPWPDGPSSRLGMRPSGRGRDATTR